MAQTPKFIKYFAKIVQISCGYEHSMFRTLEGKIYSMGSNQFG